jgi:hypothetical protein
MVRVRQFDGRVGKSTAALGLVRLEVTDMVQPGQKLAFRIAHVSGGEVGLSYAKRRPKLFTRAVWPLWSAQQRQAAVDC